MKNARVFFAFSFGVALAAACGGSSSTPGTGDAGDAASSSGSSGGGSSSGSSSGGSSGGLRDGAAGGDGGMACTVTANCPTGLVCCTGMGGTCQAQSACTTGGNRQICTTPSMMSSECSAMFPVCRAAAGSEAGAQLTCRAAMACTPTSCPTGQVCCTATAAGAVDSCAATCPAGSSQVCDLKADCPSSQMCCTDAMGNSTCGATCAAGTNPACATLADCATGTVCCQLGCQAQTACGMAMNRQICGSGAECPAAFPSCRGGPPGTCRVAMDAGAPEGGLTTDSGPLDATPDVALPLDAPSGS
jgi:hypothetical protein